jgi:hypothetical protein
MNVSNQLTTTGHGKISHVFTLAQRGLVIMLDPDFSEGSAVGPVGVIRSLKGVSEFRGPEIADGSGGSCVCVVATDPQAANFFAAGDTVELLALGPINN